MNYVNPSCANQSDNTCPNAGKLLKAANGWNYDSNYGKSGNGTDNYGFTALPGGYGSGGNFGLSYVGGYGYWWSISDYSDISAYALVMDYSYDYSYRSYFNKTTLRSIRCIKD
jgi:uncharacterized protein (TIGR02145 family)